MALQFESLYVKATFPVLKRRKYFAFVETVEDNTVPGKSEIFVRFDCITYEHGQNLKNQMLTDARLSEIPFIQIEVAESLDKWLVSFKGANEIMQSESRWLLIQTITGTDGLVANEFYNGVAQEVIHSIEALKPTEEEKEIIDALEGKFDLGTLSSTPESDVKLKLDQHFASLDKVGVLNVGQGNLNFVTGQSKVPEIYFDLGGGTGVNAGTYPTSATIVTCKSQTPLVILSHWDMDHIETAIRDASNCTLTWVVPLQKVGKTHFTLALRVNRVGSLFIWPNRSWVYTHANGEVFICNGSTKNDSGIAVCLTLQSDQILLPGDAAYRYIHKLPGYKLTSLVVSHHGSSSAATHVPNATGNQWCSYSYGAKNSYNHPDTWTQLAHQTANWNHTRDTIKQGIYFHTANYRCLCAGKSCNINTSQHF